MTTQSTSRRRGRTLAAASITAAIVAAALPAGASAAYTGAVSGSSATLTGDGASERLVVSAAGGLLRHNLAGFDSDADFDSAPGEQTLPADGSVTLTIEAGGGDDSVQVTGAVAGTAMRGGDGDDLLLGSPAVDTAEGGAGDDRIAPERSNDTMRGGDGNDVLVWNNGDGTDVMDGEGGAFDEIEVNGNPAGRDEVTIQPGPGGRVDFDRVNAPGAFGLDIGTSERLSLRTSGGADAVTVTGAPAIAISVDTGTGEDTVQGGDGAEVISGGDDVDTLRGGGGNDRISGDRGNDPMFGEAGDDTLVWNNGDGTDGNVGGAGVDVIEVNGAGAGDAFTVRPAGGGGARFDRTNLVPFGLDISESEALLVNGLAGDDALTVADGTPLAVTANGGAGADTFAGGDGPDTFAGGEGDDVLDGGGGRDLLDGQGGADRLGARDGLEDLVRGGAGADSAVVDLGDAVDAVESVDRPAAPVVAPPAPVVRVVAPGVASVRTSALRLRGGRRTVTIELACPAGAAAACEGVLRLSTATPLRLGRVRLQALLASRRYALRPGERRRLRLTLPRGIERLARGRRGLALRADAGGTTRRIVLRAAR